MNIGKYILSRMNDGCWNIQWLDPQTRHMQLIQIEDLESIFDRIVKPSIGHQFQCAEVFRNAMMTEINDFLNNPLFERIVANLNNQYPTDWDKWDADQKFRFELDSVITAYNRVHAVDLKVGEVAPYVMDLKQLFCAS